MTLSVPRAFLPVAEPDPLLLRRARYRAFQPGSWALGVTTALARCAWRAGRARAIAVFIYFSFLTIPSFDAVLFKKKFKYYKLKSINFAIYSLLSLGQTTCFAAREDCVSTRIKFGEKENYPYHDSDQGLRLPR